MKTVLVTTCWLDNDEYFQKTNKWLRYYIYNDSLKYDDIILLDNASSFENINKLVKQWNNAIMFQRFPEHMTRASHLEYPYLWRAVDFFKDLLKEYDKIIYMDNDFYILSKNMCDKINTIRDGWYSPFCTKHNFPETGLQILQYPGQFYYNNLPFSRLNGKTMELILPVTSMKDLVGDRHSEYGIIKQDDLWDFSAQVPLNMEIKFNG